MPRLKIFISPGENEESVMEEMLRRYNNLIAASKRMVMSENPDNRLTLKKRSREAEEWWRQRIINKTK